MVEFIIWILKSAPEL